MGIPTLALNSMRVSCLIFSLLLPLVITKMFLVETHDVASTTNANGMDQDGIGSNEEVERPLKVGGQDYSNGECLWNCVEVCDWKKTKGCKTCKKCVERGKCKSCKKYCSSCKWKKKKHAVASTTNANDQDGIGSNKEVDRPLKVGQDYGHGECVWKKTKGCKTCKKCVERGKCK